MFEQLRVDVLMADECADDIMRDREDRAVEADTAGDLMRTEVMGEEDLEGLRIEAVAEEAVELGLAVRARRG